MKQYEDEIKRASDEFNKKYAEYQQEQKNLPQNIQERRNSAAKRPRKTQTPAGAVVKQSTPCLYLPYRQGVLYCLW